MVGIAAAVAASAMKLTVNASENMASADQTDERKNKSTNSCSK